VILPGDVIGFPVSFFDRSLYSVGPFQPRFSHSRAGHSASLAGDRGGLAAPSRHGGGAPAERGGAVVSPWRSHVHLPACCLMHGRSPKENPALGERRGLKGRRGIGGAGKPSSGLSRADPETGSYFSASFEPAAQKRGAGLWRGTLERSSDVDFACSCGVNRLGTGRRRV
jgi:hypothetical protein